MRTIRILAAAVLATVFAAPGLRAQQTAPTRDAALKLGRITFERTFASNIDALVASADPRLGHPDSLRAKLVAGIEQINAQLGPEVKTISEKVMIVNDGVQYWRESEFTAVPVPVTFRVVVGPAGKWRGFTANTETPAGKELLP